MGNSRFKFRVWDIGRENYIDNPNLNWFNGYLGGEIGCCIILNDILHKISTDGRFILEQCTGLKDKNGNLIYESDIVKIGNGSINGEVMESELEVKWCDKLGRYNLPNWTSDKPDWSHYVEIIGNVHQTKD